VILARCSLEADENRRTNSSVDIGTDKRRGWPKEGILGTPCEIKFNDETEKCEGE
jgi:hypothetical protein